MKRALGNKTTSKDQMLRMASSVRCRVPDPWATSLTQLQGLLTARAETQKQARGAGHQNWRMPTLLKRHSCCLALALCSPQVHRVTFGAELLTQHGSIPGWACLWHTPTLKGVTGGETALKHPGIYRKTHSGWLNCLVWTRDYPASSFGFV